MRKKTRPAFYRADGTIRHWPRFDNIHRTNKQSQMWIVMDDAANNRYLLVHVRADNLMLTVVHQMNYSPSAYAIMNQMASRLAFQASNGDEPYGKEEDGIGHDGPGHSPSHPAPGASHSEGGAGRG